MSFLLRQSYIFDNTKMYYILSNDSLPDIFESTSIYLHNSLPPTNI